MRALHVLAAVVSLSGFGCDSQAGDEHVARPAPPSRRAELAERVAPEVELGPRRVDLSLGDGLEMRRPIRDGKLALIPIVATTDVPEQRFITLHDGMASGRVVVREMPRDWQVDTVRISNHAASPLFVLRGDIIVDAMQDRVLAQDLVIPPGETRLVAARCIEKSRAGGGSRFNPGHAIAEVELRRTVAHLRQDEVWAHVDRINAREGLSPASKTYRHAAEAQHQRDPRRDALAAQLAAVDGRERMVGVAVAIDNQVIAIDRFASPGVYRALEDKLLASYLPGTDGDVPPETRNVGPDEVRALMRTGTLVATPASGIVLRRK